MDTIQLDDLRLVRKIAAGGMAEVWEARQVGVEGFEKRVAVKVILPHLTDNEDFIRMFLDEGRLAAQLDHPNVCQLYKLGEAEGSFYMAMEFIEGVVLSSMMKEAAKRGVYIPFQHCCQVLIGAAAGLDYAHACTDSSGNFLNLVHRDISPQNIMITVNGSVKVVDFGIAKAATQVHHTQAGVLKGKYAYMSPEQATGKPLDLRSDIFALGVVLWEMSTGHRLFRADNEIATLHKIIGGDYEPPSSYRDDYPPELEMIVMKALAVDPDERYQDCGDLQLALEDFLLRHGMAAGSKRLAHYMKWINSDDDSPEPQGSSSIVSQAFEHSDSGVHTPSSPGKILSFNQNVVAETPIGGQLPGPGPQSAPAHQSFEMPHDPSHRPQRRRGGGGIFLVMFLVLLLGGGGAAGLYFFTNIFKQEATPLKQVLWLIRSNPPRANIFINGELKGETPKVLPFLLEQRYIVRLTLRGHESFYKQIPQLTDEMTKKPLVIPLKKETQDARYGSLVLTVKPGDSQVILSGQKLASVSPGVFSERIRAGREQVLLVQLKGYKTFQKTFQIIPDKKTTFDIKLEREKRSSRRRRPRRPGVRYVAPSKLSIRANVSGVTIYVDGKHVGKAPLPSFRVSAGDHVVIFKKSGYKTITKRVSVAKGDIEPVLASMTRSAGVTPRVVELRRSAPPAAASTTLVIGAVPKSRIYIDGRLIGTTPLWGHKLPAGRHKVKLVAVQFGIKHQRTVNLSAGRQKLFHRFKTGKLWVLTRPRAKVYLNKNYLGFSNKPPYTVPAGRYFVRFVFPDGVEKFQRGVVVSAGLKKRIIQRK